MVDQCVVGFDEHVYTRGVDRAGKPDEVVLRWPVGTPRPEGAREALMVDTTLMSALMRGLYNLARLTSREKSLSLACNQDIIARQPKCVRGVVRRAMST